MRHQLKDLLVKTGRGNVFPLWLSSRHRQAFLNRADHITGTKGIPCLPACSPHFVTRSTHRAAHHFCGRHWGSVICFSLREKRILARESLFIFPWLWRRHLSPYKPRGKNDRMDRDRGRWSSHSRVIPVGLRFKLPSSVFLFYRTLLYFLDILLFAAGPFSSPNLSISLL